MTQILLIILAVAFVVTNIAIYRQYIRKMGMPARRVVPITVVFNIPFIIFGLLYLVLIVFN